MLTIASPIRDLHHIGTATEPRLKRLGITTVHDLLWYLPYRYEDLSHVQHISDIHPDEMTTIRGTIELIASKRSFRKHMMITELQLRDETGIVRATWFRQGYVAKVLKSGDEIYISGKPKATLLGLQFINPVYEKVKDEQLHTAHIVPFYQLTEGISHKQLRFLIQTAFSFIKDIPDDLPKKIYTSEKFLSLEEALRSIHHPKDRETLATAIERLKFEELFWIQLTAGYAKRFYQQHQAPSITFKQEAVSNCVASLPFTLTHDQKKAAWDILKDMTRTIPMNRLIQGDVGSGKTIVASLAMLNTALNKFQSVLMAPTELLALQHYTTIMSFLQAQRSQTPISCGLLTRSHSILNGENTKKTDLRNAMKQGSVDIIVGTHALLQDQIALRDLALVIIDEQHRFGVVQRQRLTELAQHHLVPHLLSLTATPIPRTLALSLYGDLDISSIRQKPAGRKPIITKIISEDSRDKAYAFIQDKVRQKQQVFILCPLINERDTSESKSVLSEYERLRKDIFSELDLRYVHGKMKSKEKKKILDDFAKNAFPILVSTSVIEVGIDIPNATIMVIEGAERFGLAQLHQFRGRVGRNAMQSYCLLFTDSSSPMTLKRLSYLVAHDDGFELAEADLALRGEGNVFGTQQSGIVNFKIATIHDTALIKKSRSWVDRIIEEDKDLSYYSTIQERIEGADKIHWE